MAWMFPVVGMPSSTFLSILYACITGIVGTAETAEFAAEKEGMLASRYQLYPLAS